eukprot:gb/GECG01004520.1/.p1 GENE.gb/GECG01004520.1/~~gb/GECG01004520.1/.p1  ORF type:complete len:162 (+),score=11.85 gb/GECG01004520.1/:1-486(+)
MDAHAVRTVERRAVPASPQTRSVTRTCVTGVGLTRRLRLRVGPHMLRVCPTQTLSKKAAPVTYGNTFETTTGGSAQDEYQEEGATGENAKLIKKERYSTTFSSGVGLLADLTKWRSIARAADRNAAKVKVLLRHCSNVNLRTGRKVVRSSMILPAFLVITV